MTLPSFERTCSPETIVLQRNGATSVEPLVEALCQSTTFVQGQIDDGTECTYSRVTNPTVEALEKTLGALEAAPPSVCFSSGLAAETALFLALLRQGDHLVVSQAIYGGTVRLVREILANLGIAATFVDSTQSDQVAAAIQPNTKLIFIETPANPTLVLTDISEIAEISRRAGVLLAVDNTFLTPVGQQPLELGADISVYSTTKHIDGHSCAVGGAITSRNPELIERLRWIRKSTGGIQTPQNAWNTLRGLKTLAIRFERHSQNAQIVAEALADDPRVRDINYPGLSDFSQRDLALRQHRACHGGVLSFELEGGYETARRFLSALTLCSLVEHVGSVETLITHPASMTHADVPADQLAAVGLTPGLLRLSVGIEDPHEILADVTAAVGLAQEATRSQQGGLVCAST